MTPDSIPQFDLYGELEVSRRASVAVIESVHRALVKRHRLHVALATDDDRIRRLDIAREWLTDPERRRLYDEATAAAAAAAQDDHVRLATSTLAGSAAARSTPATPSAGLRPSRSSIDPQRRRVRASPRIVAARSWLPVIFASLALVAVVGSVAVLDRPVPELAVAGETDVIATAAATPAPQHTFSAALPTGDAAPSTPSAAPASVVIETPVPSPTVIAVLPTPKPPPPPAPTPRPTPRRTVAPLPTPPPTPAPTPTPTPVPTPTPTPTPAPTPTPTPVPMCVVPNFQDVWAWLVEDRWEDAGFTGPVTFVPTQGFYQIDAQSLVAGSSAACTSAITVYD